MATSGRFCWPPVGTNYWPLTEVIKELQITEATWYRWLNQYGGEKAESTKRTKELEKENARLKKLVAEKELAIDILNEVARGKF